MSPLQRCTTTTRTASTTRRGNSCLTGTTVNVPLSKDSLLSQIPPSQSVNDECSVKLEPSAAAASLTGRMVCLALLGIISAIWCKYTFIDEAQVPNALDRPVHSPGVTLALTVGYLVSLPLLRYVSHSYLRHWDMKVLLRESMIVYNATQVLLNGWMVYRIVHALLYRNHPWIGADMHLVHTGATYAVWVHYCDKYLEFLDTYFMILRGKMDQVSSQNPWTIHGTLVAHFFLLLS
jgi:GNS1/SUR4 family